MKTVEVIVKHAGKNLSAYIEGAPVITVGNDIKEIEDNMKEAIELYLKIIRILVKSCRESLN